MRLVDELLALRAKLRDGIRPVEGTGSKLEADAESVAAAEGVTEVEPEAGREDGPERGHGRALRGTGAQ